MTPVAAARAGRSARNEIVVDPRSRGEARVGEVDRPRLTWPLALLPLIALAVVGPMFGARLGAIDDHEIVSLQRLLENGGPVQTWLATDVGNGRFRPLYWVGIIVETALWGQNAAGWYLDRLLLAIATLAAGYALARVWFRPLVAAAVAALIVAGPQAEAFARLGPQEAFAVPLTLAGLALVGSRRVGAGIALTIVAALVKEPFALTAAVAIAWAWSLGRHRLAMLGAVALGIAGIGIAHAWAAGGTPEQVRLGGVELAGRYLYPFVIGVALAAGYVASRSRLVLVPLTVLIIVATAGQVFASSARSAETRAFAGELELLRASGRPLVVVVGQAGLLEYARAIRVYLADTPMALVSLALTPGFDATVGADCVEVTVAAVTTGRCWETVALR